MLLCVRRFGLKEDVGVARFDNEPRPDSSQESQGVSQATSLPVEHRLFAELGAESPRLFAEAAYTSRLMNPIDHALMGITDRYADQEIAISLAALEPDRALAVNDRGKIAGAGVVERLEAHYLAGSANSAGAQFIGALSNGRQVLVGNKTHQFFVRGARIKRSQDCLVFSGPASFRSVRKCSQARNLDLLSPAMDRLNGASGYRHENFAPLGLRVETLQGLIFGVRPELTHTDIVSKVSP